MFLTSIGRAGMRFAVCLTYVPDPDTVEVDPLTGQIDVSRALYVLNPADAVALEMALRLRSGNDGDRPHGRVRSRRRRYYGMRSPSEPITSCASGMNPVQYEASCYVNSPRCERTLRGLPDLVLCGARTLDRGSGKSSSALLGEYLDWPVVTARYHEFRYQRGTGAFSAPPRPRRTVRGRGDDASGVGHRSGRDAAAIRQPARTYTSRPSGHNSGAASSSGFRTFAAGREDFRLRRYM